MNRDQLYETIDRRLRRELLVTINAAQSATPDGFIAGTTLYDLRGPGSPPINQAKDENHVLNLLVRLQINQLAEMKDRRVYRDEPWGLGCTVWRITEKGIWLLNEEIDPIDSIFDRRIPQT